MDASVIISLPIAKMGGRGYAQLIGLNRLINKARMKLGHTSLSLTNRGKCRVKSEIKYISDFESAAINHAVSQDHEYVIYGHIHQS